MCVCCGWLLVVVICRVSVLRVRVVLFVVLCLSLASFVVVGCLFADSAARCSWFVVCCLLFGESCVVVWCASLRVVRRLSLPSLVAFAVRCAWLLFVVRCC